MSISIMLVDDHKLMRDGLRALLEKQTDFDVVGEAEDGQTAARKAKLLKPDVAVMDVCMPNLNGIEASRRIVRQAPSVKIVALSMHMDRRFVNGMLGAGASGYVLKHSALEELNEAIRTVHSGRIYTSPRISDVVVEDYVRRISSIDSEDGSPLTSREREVLQLLAEGRASRAIAKQLHLSINTIDTHRRRIMSKLRRHSVAELTKYAIREGLTSLDA